MDKRKSFSTQEKRQQTIKNKLDARKAALRASLGTKKPPDMSNIEVRQMADEYEKAMCTYKRTKRRYLKENIERNSPSWVILYRAVGFAKELKVDFSTYVRGIFYIADKWWKKAPKLRELADYLTKIPAKERVAIYLLEVEEGAASITLTITSGVRTMEVPQEVKDTLAARQLRTFMKNFKMTEEEVLIEYAGETAELYFDSVWLGNNITYQRLADAGEV